MKQDSKPFMSNTVDKHTPGPWYANSGMIYGGSHGATIAVFYTNGGNLQPISEEEKEANMNLCAEAPTLKKENEELKERNRVLVEALQECREWYVNNADKIAPETPICFSKVLSLIQSNQ